MELLVCALERELEVSSCVVAVSDCSAGLGEVDTCSGGSLCFSLGVLPSLAVSDCSAGLGEVAGGSLCFSPGVLPSLAVSDCSAGLGEVDTYSDGSL